MDMNNLIHMANKIGQFFESQPDHDGALLGIAAHLRNFWAPRMREQLLDYIDKNNNTSLSPIVLEALLRHRNGLQPHH